MKRALVILALCLLTPAAWTQEFPGLFAVTGVTAPDTLNVRDMPTARGEVIGVLPHDDSRIEVLRLSNDGGWGMIPWGERMGWVSMRFMAAEAPAPDDAVATPLLCAGTEPFWSLDVWQEDVFFTAPGLDTLNLTRVDAAAANREYLLKLRTEAGEDYTAIIDRTFCSDGMSDREYGYKISLFRDIAEGGGLVTGCCTLDAHQRQPAE